MHVIRDNGCELFEETGCPAAPDHDRRTDFHFNALLDAVAEWKLERLNLSKSKSDTSHEKGENYNRFGFCFFVGTSPKEMVLWRTLLTPGGNALRLGLFL